MLKDLVLAPKLNGNIVSEPYNLRILDEHGQITKESLKSFIKPPYPVTYYYNLAILVMGSLVLPLIYYGIIPTHQQGFICNDPLFSHKYTGNTITPAILAVGEVILISLVLFIEIYARVKSFKGIFKIPSMVESYYYLKYVLLGIMVVEGITEIPKGIVGEHRPDFFDMCKPDTNLNCTDGEYIWTFTCMNTDNFGIVDLVDSSRSFPSGHSSISWFTALYCAYIIQSRLPVRTTGIMFKMLMLGICIMWGMLCSLTRITDRRHHWWDVLFGTLIGIAWTIYMVKITEKKFSHFRRVEHEQMYNRRKESIDIVNFDDLQIV